MDYEVVLLCHKKQYTNSHESSLAILVVCSTPTLRTVLNGVMVASAQPGPECLDQAIPAKDMAKGYNWQSASQGYEVFPAPAGAPYQPQPPAYDSLMSLGILPGGTARP